MLGACSDLLLQQQQQQTVRIVGREQQSCYSSIICWYCNPKSSTHFSRSSQSLAFVSRSRIAAASKEGGAVLETSELLSSLLVIGDGDFWRRDSFFHTSLCLYAWFWDANADAGVGERRISGRKTEGRKSFCADQCHQSCKNLAGCSKKPKKSWRILASSSATVAAEVHSFLLLAAFFPVIDSECFSLSPSLASVWCEVSCDSWVGGWAGARHHHGYGKKMLLKKRETALCIPDDDPWMRFVRFVYGGDDAPWREIWQIYALGDHPWKGEIWERFVHWWWSLAERDLNEILCIRA